MKANPTMFYVKAHAGVSVQSGLWQEILRGREAPEEYFCEILRGRSPRSISPILNEWENDTARVKVANCTRAAGPSAICYRNECGIILTRVQYRP